MKIPILYEDDYCLVINKPAGVVTNNSDTAKGKETVQSFLQNKFFKGVDFDTSEHKEYVMRSGLIHRLDKETSGVLICAKDPEFFNAMLLKFKNREVRKEYLAIAFADRPLENDYFVVDAPIGRNPKNRTRFCIDPANGRSAVTEFKVIKHLGKRDGSTFILVSCFPKTGRTHQIRVHLAAVEAPVAGDILYSGRNRSVKFHELFPRQMLHAALLSFEHPFTNEVVTYEAPIPDDMQKSMDILKI